MISTRNFFTPWNTLDPAVIRPGEDTQYTRNKEHETESPFKDRDDWVHDEPNNVQ